MARIYKKNNSYYFSFEAGRDERTGKRQRIVRGGFRTKKEAQQASAELEVKFNAGNVIAKPSDITLHDFMWEHWLEHHKNFIKLSTLKGIESFLRRIDRFFGNYTQIKNISVKDCQRFAIDMVITWKLKRSVARGTLGYLHQIFKFAIMVEKILSVNPVENIEIPKPKNETAISKPLYLEKEVLKRFLEVSYLFKRDFSYHMASVMMIYTGMRAGEVIGLEWENIDFEKCIIRVRRGYYYLGHGKYTIQTPKTKTSIRDIPIHNQLIVELKKYRKEFLAFKMANASRWENTEYDFVFTSYYCPGRPFSAQNLEHWLRRKGRLIGADYLHPHIFRHTHVSLLAEQGVSLEVISDRLGHVSSSTTRKIYLHVTKSSRLTAAENFDKIMSKIQTGT